MAVLYSFLLLLLRKRTKKKNKRIKDFQNEYLSTSSFLFSSFVTPSIAKQKNKKKKHCLISWLRSMVLLYYCTKKKKIP